MKTITIWLATLAAASTARADNGPPLQPNAQPYHVRTPAAATGRSGNATLAARALLNKDGSADYDATTGTLDAPASSATGNIAKLQVKTYLGTGDVAWTKNYAGLAAPSLHYAYADLHRGQPIQSQANVRSLDGKRTDVVTVTGNVKLRPDLAVRGVSAPSQATVGSTVNIAATVSELNGDTGAHASCVLSVDGSAVDTIDGMWVDSGSTVSCAFAQQFTSVGTHSLQVAVTNVVPGDWDLSNNQGGVTIKIVPAQTPFYYWASASSYTYRYAAQSDGWYQYSDGTFAASSDWSSQTSQTYMSEGASISGYSPVALSFPLDVSLAMSADGAPLAAASYANVQPDWSWSWYGGSYASVYRFDPATYTYFFLDAYSWYGWGGTYTSAGRFAGEVTYFSQGFSSYWENYYGTTYGGYWSWNYDYSYAWGQPWTMTSTFSADLQISDAAGHVLSASPTIPLSSYDWGWSWPYSCFDWSWGWGAEHVCSGGSFDVSGASGWTFGSTGT